MESARLDELEARLLVVIGSIAGRLPADQVASVAELARAGEPGVALENLCTQLYEYFVFLPEPMLQEVEYLARAMGLNPQYTALLRTMEHPEA